MIVSKVKLFLKMSRNSIDWYVRFVEYDVSTSWKDEIAIFEHINQATWKNFNANLILLLTFSGNEKMFGIYNLQSI